MDEVIVNRDGPVLRIRLNRPESRNALNFDVIDQILDALEALVGDANVNFGLPLSAREFYRRPDVGFQGRWLPRSRLNLHVSNTINSGHNQISTQ